MRWFFALFILIGLVGCSAPPATTSTTPIPQPTVPGLAEVLERPPKEAIQTIGYLIPMDGGAALIGGLSFAHGESPQALEIAGSIWLPEPLVIPAANPQAAAWQLVQASGTLSAVGNYGPNGGYPYQLEQIQLKALEISDLNIEQLLSNTGGYINQAVRIRAQILISESSALLVETLGSGGVPDANARQIKLSGPVERGALLDQLNASGNTHFGAVEVVGIWHGQSLYVLSIRAE
ncbi:hypothetical protein [Candidatus Oscillochloris fontis]|uniref:hypothetical protein n=1 Tax=Candidatus Oscillochloris fontis TaxID=2496868 RepID=UPI00101C49F4|nr:hypothetical protein [Candidatus Oscillochloris fontis]